MNVQTIRLEIHVFNHNDSKTTNDKPATKKRGAHPIKRWKRCPQCARLFKYRSWLKKHVETCRGVNA